MTGVKFERLGSKSWAAGKMRKHPSNGSSETITPTVFEVMEWISLGIG